MEDVAAAVAYVIPHPINTQATPQQVVQFGEWFDAAGSTDFVVDSPKPVGASDQQVYIPLEVNPDITDSLLKVVSGMTRGGSRHNINISPVPKSSVRRKHRWHNHDPSVSFALVYAHHRRGMKTHRQLGAVCRIVQLAEERVGLMDYSIRVSGQERLKLGRMISANYPVEELTAEDEVNRLIDELRLSRIRPPHIR